MDFSNTFRRFLMNRNHIASSVHKSYVVAWCDMFVFWFVAFRPGQHYFSHVGMLSLSSWVEPVLRSG